MDIIVATPIFNIEQLVQHDYNCIINILMILIQCVT